jgi:hypothetical protein
MAFLAILQIGEPQELVFDWTDRERFYWMLAIGWAILGIGFQFFPKEEIE